MPLTRFFVSNKDIKEGECGNPSRCAVARAVARRIKPGYHVSVTPHAVKIILLMDFKNPLVNHRCSGNLTKFIMDFDASSITYVRGHLKPIQFAMDVPSYMLNNKFEYTKRRKANGRVHSTLLS